MRWTAVGVALVVLVGAGVGWTLYRKLEGNITTDVGTAEELERYDAERPATVSHEAKNILVLGSDTRAGGNRRYGQDSGTARSDTAILLHLSADRTNATAVSIPRDLMVTIPDCARPEGGRTKEQFAQFNWSFQFGGAACTIRTVEKLTDIRVDHHVVVDFKGFKRIVDSVGGVEVCLDEPVSDPDAQLELPAGRQTLKGEDALGYVRARHGIGNGSDTQRMARQQEFLASLFGKVRSNGVLMNPAKLYPVLDAATSSITADAGLNSLTELYELVRSVRDMPEENVRFMTVPRQPYAQNPNRDELVQPDADRLFAQLRNDKPVQGDEDDSASGASDGQEPGGGTSGAGEADGEGRAAPGDTVDDRPDGARYRAEHGAAGTAARTVTQSCG
ncbi:LCP family protein [Streptomyces sp. 549]|nr:LCP family protein [Streptomyces sp. 549]MDK1475735.1 LCP family protein [Streptomyces sp. 549]